MQQVVVKEPPSLEADVGAKPAAAAVTRAVLESVRRKRAPRKKLIKVRKGSARHVARPLTPARPAFYIALNSEHFALCDPARNLIECLWTGASHACMERPVIIPTEHV